MPTYLFENKETGETFEVSMKISERDDFLKSNPNLIQLVNGFPGIGDPIRLGRVKPDSQFTDLLKKVKRNNPGSTIRTDF